MDLTFGLNISILLQILKNPALILNAEVLFSHPENIKNTIK